MRTTWWQRCRARIGWFDIETHVDEHQVIGWLLLLDVAEFDVRGRNFGDGIRMVTTGPTFSGFGLRVFVNDAVVYRPHDGWVSDVPREVRLRVVQAMERMMAHARARRDAALAEASSGGTDDQP